jgi:hypothetical protein
VAVHVPVAPATLAALLGGHRGALEDDPVMARMLAILRAPGALGDFGMYHGVGEIGLGWETFAPSPDANPTLGAAGQIEHFAHGHARQLDPGRRPRRSHRRCAGGADERTRGKCR